MWFARRMGQDMATEVSVTHVACFSALGRLWQALEARSDASFFQRWAWVGCLAEERYPDPVLVQASRGGVTLGLALLNRRGSRLWLMESGSPAIDAPFVEHNGPLLARDAGPDVAAALLRASLHAVPRARRLTLAGVGPATLAAARHAGGTPIRLQERTAPVLRLNPVRAAGEYLGTRSGNTRYQVRRSARHYGVLGDAGPRAVHRADTVQDACALLDELVALHALAWQRRGKPGAFAGPFVLRFHRALIARAMPAGGIDLLRVTSPGTGTVGVLYNLRQGRTVCAYQSGFDYDRAGPHGKPGLTCHHLAIERSLVAGDLSYDFLAGADRYKLSLANDAQTMLWAELAPRWSVAGLTGRARLGLARLVDLCRTGPVQEQPSGGHR